jgi:hypothetical protein
MDEYLTYIKPQGTPSVKRLDSSCLLASRWGIRAWGARTRRSST